MSKDLKFGRAFIHSNVLPMFLIYRNLKKNSLTVHFPILFWIFCLFYFHERNELVKSLAPEICHPPQAFL